MAKLYPWASPEAVNRLSLPQLWMYLEGRVEPKREGFALRNDAEIMAFRRARKAGVPVKTRAELMEYMKAEADEAR